MRAPGSSLVFCLSAALVLSGAASADVEGESAALLGLWKHAEKPAVLEMRTTDDGAVDGTVLEAKRPDMVGQRLFRALKRDTETGAWVGRIYALDLGRELDVEVRLEQADRLEATVRFGFLSRRVIWVRYPGAAPARSENDRPKHER